MPPPPGAPVQFYDSMSRALVPFAPAEIGVARMYTCGPTVYSRAHLGNMRPYVFADTVRRLLLWKGYDVRHIINITDVGHLLADADFGDDKVEEAAKREQRTVWDLTAHYTRLFQDDFLAIECLAPENWTKATDFIPQMLAFAQRLEALGHTYVLPSGLYFDTSTIDGYGAMATMQHEGNIEGARVDVIEDRRNPSDFALWRTFAPDDPPHAMEWDSPWGRGAPGWHLECSVMSIQELGPHFDIHTGGVDHREVHHPNEDAESRAYNDDGRPWLGLWMHCEWLIFGGEKMAKSKGNVMTLDNARAVGDPLAYRLLLLQSHYQKQIHVTKDDLESASKRFDRLVESVRRRLGEGGEVDRSRRLVTLASARERAGENTPVRTLLDRMDEAMSNNLGTPVVLATVDEALRAASLSGDEISQVLEMARSLLGIDLQAAAAEELPGLPPEQAEAVERLIAERETARRDKDFAKADEVRDRLASEFNVVLEDTADGTTWKVTR